MLNNNKTSALPLNLQFFSEPGNDPKDPPAYPPVDPPKTDPNNEPPADPKTNDHMIHKSRFDEVNNNYKTVKDQLDKILEQQKQDEQNKQKEQGEFEELYSQTSQELETYKNDLKSTKERADALEGIMTSMLNTKLETIPEEFHDLIPENLSSEQKLDWVSKAEAKGLFKDKSQETLGGATNPPAGTQDLENMPVNLMLQSGYKK